MTSPDAVVTGSGVGLEDFLCLGGLDFAFGLVRLRARRPASVRVYVWFGCTVMDASWSQDNAPLADPAGT